MMGCIIHIWHTKFHYCPALLIVMLACAVSLSVEGSSLADYENTTLITLPDRDLEIRSTKDNRGVLLHFSRWDDEFENRIRNSLSKTSLQYRRVWGYPGAGTVEIYSMFRDVAYSSIRERRQTQVLIGERRFMRSLEECLMPGSKTIPLSEEAIRSFRTDRPESLRRALETAARDNSTCMVSRSRVGAISAMIDMSDRSQCPELPAELSSAEELESAILSAVCLQYCGLSVQAISVLDRLRAVSEDEAFSARVENIRYQVAFTGILNAARMNDPLKTTLQFLLNESVLFRREDSRSLFNEVFRAIQNSGFEHIAGMIANRLIVLSDDAQLAEMAGLIAYAYYLAGENIRASDVASYYLERRTGLAQRGELLGIRGMTYLRTGSWELAVRDLVNAETIRSVQLPDEQLSHVEALLRMRSGGFEPTTALTDRLRQMEPQIREPQRIWFERLMGQAEVESHRIPSRDLLDRVPSHVLYRNAMSSSESSFRNAILSVAAERTDGWGQQAGVALDLDALRTRFNALQLALEDN